ELKERRSSGWKPYNRVKWYVEQRLDANGIAPASARWDVWREKMARERSNPRAARSSWFCVGPTNISGRILDIEIDPTNTDIVYIGSASGGLWKSTDGGDTYVTLTDHLPSLAIGAVAVLPWNTDIVLIGTGEGNGANTGAHGIGILRSTDAGATWDTTNVTSPVSESHGFCVIEVNPTTGTILAGATDGLWRSTDEGLTLDLVKEGGTYYDV
ncbi:MAG: hypothetical protein GY704_13180, partial [Phycisphaeraceae bacterium]|nr:hypothetical protein [Phycisphaeraceae bacterium]